MHKGILPNGKEVAVKSLKTGSGQGEREFQAEVEIISRVHHRHLVSLVGYCIAGGQRMLVYEFVSNKELDYHLHGNVQLSFSLVTLYLNDEVLCSQTDSYILVKSTYYNVQCRVMLPPIILR